MRRTTSGASTSIADFFQLLSNSVHAPCASCCMPSSPLFSSVPSSELLKIPSSILRHSLYTYTAAADWLRKSAQTRRTACTDGEKKSLADNDHLHEVFCKLRL